MKILFFATLLAFFSNIAIANNVPLSVNVATGSGGMTAGLVHPLVDGLEKRGFDIDLVMAGDCVNSKRIIDRSDDPTIAFWSNLDLATNELCDVGLPSNQTFVNLVWHMPEYFCSKEDPAVALNSSNTKVGVPAEMPERFSDAFLNHNPDLTLVTYYNSGDMANALVANEINAVVNARGLTFQENDLVTCGYVTDSGIGSDYEPLASALNVENLDYAYVMYAYALNVDAETKSEFTKALQEVLSSEEEVIAWFENFSIPSGIQFEDVDVQINFLEESTKVN